MPRFCLRRGAKAAAIVIALLTGLIGAARPGAAQPAPAAAPLTADDVGAWLDGFVPYALHAGDIAGAVVVVVKDDKILALKGYGWADVARRRPVNPQTTLFRPASISKLFTWTAVMQLVEAGKLDLDADVNRYLDFRIPPRDGKPVTLRELMTHTAGFEEQAKDLYAVDAAHLTPLAQYERTHLPRRVFPPGEVVAYSNYGAGLAGLIVQRVSGEPYQAYVERHILAPLGMAHSTFREPLPAALAGDLANGYALGSGPPKPFEWDNIAPAGALTTSGADMARFMIAHLNDGRFGAAQILAPASAEQMHATAFRSVPGVNGMTLGFFEGDRNGHRVIGHDGDLDYFHSELDLVLDQHVGVFVSINSAGAGAANEAIRLQLFRGFLDRYFPAPLPDPPRLATALTDAKRVTGDYVLSRRSATTVTAGLSALVQTPLTADANGDLGLPILDRLLGSPPRRWREVAPMVWQEAGGRSRLAAVVRGGRVVAMTTDDFAAGAVLQPAPFWLSQAWLVPAMGASLAVLALYAALWPIGALARRRYGGKFELSGRVAMLFRAARLAALADIVAVLGWLALLLGAFGDTAGGDPALDFWFRGFQLVAALGALGAVAAAADGVRVWRDRSAGWASKGLAALVVVAMAVVIATELAAHVFNPSLAY